MEVFVLNPDQRRESVEAFNARLREYAAGQAVLNVSAKLVGRQLVLSLLGTDHLDESEVHSGMPCVFPCVHLLEVECYDLEEKLNSFVQDINGSLMDPNDKNTDLQVINIETFNVDFDGSCKAWVVLLISYGVLDIPGVPNGE